MEASYKEIFDTQGTLRCVRFESGHVGVVDAQGKVLLERTQFQRLEFAEHGFLKAHCGREFFIDLKSGELYAHMPEFVRYGDFELASIGGFLCTRTKKLYEVSAHPAQAWLGKGGLYLSLPYKGEPEERVLRGMVERRRPYYVCLLKGDERKVYWLLGKFKDDSVLVMDEQGMHRHVWLDRETGKVKRRNLGRIAQEEDRSGMRQALDEIERAVARSLAEEAAKERREALLERERQIRTLTAVEPFQIGDKWGLRQGGRILAPPIYRRIQTPVGRYCAFELHPRRWGVMAVDGKTEIDPRYEAVVIHPDGLVELTIRPGRVVTRELGQETIVAD